MEAQKQKLKRTQKEISKPEDFTDPEVLYNKLITTIREYHPSTDLSMVEKAYKLARDAHKDQKRKSGEPYIIHPLCVAIILAELELERRQSLQGSYMMWWKIQRQRWKICPENLMMRLHCW